MNPFTRLRETINNSPKAGDIEIRPRKRCDSVPLLGREIWASRQKPYVPVEKPTRSNSLGSRTSGRHYGRSRLRLDFWPEPATQGSSTPITPRAEGYDSDEEDERNGVPTRYSQGECLPFQKWMKNEVEAEFLRLEQRSERLSATLRECERQYMEGRRLFFETRGLDWTEAQWNRFLFAEKSFFDLRDELFAVQDKMERRTAHMYIFMEHIPPPLDSSVWIREKDATLWSLEGAAEQRARRGEYPVLEWRGVDYNATEQKYEDYEKFSSPT